jgi:transaldolase/glucose-6-phosphate isomerase
LLERADEVALASDPQVPPQENLALRLGAIAAGLAQNGADKLTLLLSKSLAPLGACIEQLVAGSTGKNGRGVVPINGEPPGKKDSYGTDRFFVSLSLAGEAHDMSFLAESGHPVLQWKLSGPEDLAGEFVRWEIAAAVMAAVLDVAPAAEPDLPAFKERVLALLHQGAPPAEPALRSQGLALFCSPDHAQILRRAAGTLGAQSAASSSGWIAAHLALADEGDYLALLAYLPPSDETERQFNQVQAEVRNATKLACTFDFGPRHLHSTGQLHRGGPGHGLFILVTSDGGDELPVPFRALFAAQARGDLEDLQARGRRVLRVHVEDGKPEKALEALREAVKRITK